MSDQSGLGFSQPGLSPGQPQPSPSGPSMHHGANYDLDSASEFSDTSSLDGSMSGATTPIRTFALPPLGSDGQGNMIATSSSAAASREQLLRLVERLQQENRVLKLELDTQKMRTKALQEENTILRKNSVMIQAKAEQEEEFISNTLLKKISALKREKEVLAQNYEQEEECLTNDLSRKLLKLQREKVELEANLEREQEGLVNKLMRKVDKLEHDIQQKQQTLEQLRREKGELENSLEQEQEALVNKLWIRMNKLEAEKRMLQQRLEQPQIDLEHGQPDHLRSGPDTPEKRQVELLKSEVERMKYLLDSTSRDHEEKMQILLMEEKHMKEENERLRRRLHQETERREEISRNFSESESSLDTMDTEKDVTERGRTRTRSSPGSGRKILAGQGAAGPSHSATFPVPLNVPPRVRQSPHRFATPSPLPPPSPMDTSDARSDHGGDMSGNEF